MQSPPSTCLVVHPTGNANVRGMVYGLHHRDALAAYCTTLGFPQRSLLLKAMPPRLRQQVSRRQYRLPGSRMITLPLPELRRLMPRAIMRWVPGGRLSVDDVYARLDRHVARLIDTGRLPEDDRITQVYGYEDGCAETFEAAGRRGWERVYELPMGYWRACHRILREEAELNPEWAPTLEAFEDSEAKLARKDRELEQADKLVAASSFSAATVGESPGGARRPVAVFPYGAPPVDPGIAAIRESRPAAGKLRVLFVGSVRQRKGVSYLFRAMEMMGDRASLTVIGQAPRHVPVVQRNLARHRYIPHLSHREVLVEMAGHDVFVFPSLFEGFGLVILEAMACGLPVITTPHTAGPDIIESGKDGFIVPVRAPEMIAEKLMELYKDSGRLQQMRAAAQEKAARFTWNSYQDNIYAYLKGR